jgi:hypothetical protein
VDAKIPPESISRGQIARCLQNSLQRVLEESKCACPGRYVDVLFPLRVWLPANIGLVEERARLPHLLSPFPSLPVAPQPQLPLTAQVIEGPGARKRGRPPKLNKSATSDECEERPVKRARVDAAPIRATSPPLGDVVVLRVREHRGALDNLEFLTDYSDGDTIWVPLRHHVYEENNEIWYSDGLKTYIETVPSGTLVRKTVRHYIARMERELAQRLSAPGRRLRAHEYYHVISVGSGEEDD